MHHGNVQFCAAEEVMLPRITRPSPEVCSGAFAYCMCRCTVWVYSANISCHETKHDAMHPMLPKPSHAYENNRITGQSRSRRRHCNTWRNGGCGTTYSSASNAFAWRLGWSAPNFFLNCMQTWVSDTVRDVPMCMPCHGIRPCSVRASPQSLHAKLLCCCPPQQIKQL